MRTSGRVVPAAMTTGVVQLFTDCAVSEYYSSLFHNNNSTTLGNVEEEEDEENWTSITRAALENLLFQTHRRVVPYTYGGSSTSDDDNNNDSNDSNNNNPDTDDVWKALIDLDAGVVVDDDGTNTTTATVKLFYSSTTATTTTTGSNNNNNTNNETAVTVPALPHGTSTTWNREHIWPSSRGVGYSTGDSMAFTDLHHLRPADWNINAIRSNLFFGKCSLNDDNNSNNNYCQSPAYTTEPGYADTAKSRHIFTPPRISRGDVARALLYMDVRYSASNNNNIDLYLTDCPSQEDADATTSDEDEQKELPTEMAYLSILLQWHEEDPVDAYEQDRNTRVCERYQGNRNPFIDFPHLVHVLFGGSSGDDNPSNCSNGGNSSSTNPVDGGGATNATVPPDNNNNSNNPDDDIVVVQPGDVMIVGFQSDNPDWVAMVALRLIPASTQLYMTDNAWITTSFRSNEGSLVLNVPNDIPIGTIFGYGPNLLYGDRWVGVENDKGFALSTTDGDTILVYTTTTSTTVSSSSSSLSIHPIAALSFSGPWLTANNDTEEDSTASNTAQSELPPGLENYAVTFIDHVDNAYYSGPVTTLTKEQYQAHIRDTTQFWTTSNSILPANEFPSQFVISPSSSPSSNATTATTTSSAAAALSTNVIVTVGSVLLLCVVYIVLR